MTTLPLTESFTTIPFRSLIQNPTNYIYYTKSGGTGLSQKTQMNTEIFYMKHLCHGHLCVPYKSITAESKLSLLIAI